MIIDLEKRFEEVKRSEARHRIAVVSPYDKTIMSVIDKAYKMKLIEPWFVGDKELILKVLEDTSMVKENMRIINTTMEDAPYRACQLIIDNECDILMKGNIHTDELLKAVIKSKLIIPNHRISHIYTIYREGEKPLFISDPSIAILPSIEEKKHIINNLISLLHKLGIEKPRIAILSSVESVNKDIPSSVDAEELTKLYAHRDDCYVYGPLGLDNAVSLQASLTKGITNEVAGKADALIVPSLDSGNMLSKGLIYIAGMQATGVLYGTTCPIVFTSRSAEEDEKMRTLYFACHINDID